jgi:hypothetical protein
LWKFTFAAHRSSKVTSYMEVRENGALVSLASVPKS